MDKKNSKQIRLATLLLQGVPAYDMHGLDPAAPFLFLPLLLLAATGLTVPFGVSHGADPGLSTVTTPRKLGGWQNVVPVSRPVASSGAPFAIATHPLPARHRGHHQAGGNHHRWEGEDERVRKKTGISSTSCSGLGCGWHWQ